MSVLGFLLTRDSRLDLLVIAWTLYHTCSHTAISPYRPQTSCVGEQAIGGGTPGSDLTSLWRRHWNMRSESKQHPAGRGQPAATGQRTSAVRCGTLVIGLLRIRTRLVSARQAEGRERRFWRHGSRSMPLLAHWVAAVMLAWFETFPPLVIVDDVAKKCSHCA